jgi:exodeoxyribonuclease V beta subunit
MSSPQARRSFDICGPLPTGVTVLEASAGTGKTYTIAALATRYVAEGMPLDALLLVTFTRLATGELRDRVRQRLQRTYRELEKALAGEDPPDIEAVSDDDALARLLAGGTRTEVQERLDRLVRAIADFDAATITTTHGFCQEVLGSFGVAGDIDPAYAVIDDADDLTRDVVDDLYVREFADLAPMFSRSEAGDAAAAAVKNPGAPLAPAAQSPDGGARARRTLALSTRTEVDRRKRALALMSYDDLVSRLRETLEAGHGDEIAAALRARYRVALVDEFQDTDPDQWSIMRRAFDHEDATLVLIGDPKQAVYSFRGADVYAYLDAREQAGTLETLDTNWRSDQGLLDAYDALFGATHLGHEGIVYGQASAPPENTLARMSGAPVGTPLRLRVLARRTPGVRATDKRWSKAPSACSFIARDLAGDVATLLGAGPQTSGTPLTASDVAVLVRTNRQAKEIKDALRYVGVPAVVNGAGSVFTTTAARNWAALLAALERPESLPRAKAVALTMFLGWSAEEVAGADDEQWDELQQQLHSWAGVLKRHGVATLLETISIQRSLTGRLLAELGGERELTDLRQLGELLHLAAIEGTLGVTALAGWLRGRMAGDQREIDTEARMRRLESDADAVQVLTIHRSKGLEFAVVYCPFLWNPWRARPGQQPAIYHDTDDGQERKVDVAMDEADRAYKRHQAQAREEQDGEELRLVYVALSRAKHQAVLWWATTWESRSSPLGCLLYGGEAARSWGQGVDEAASSVSDRCKAIVALAPASIALERALIVEDARWDPPPRPAGDLSAAEFERSLDMRWRRLSFTSITAGSYEARVASELEEVTGSDDASGHRPLASSGATGEQHALLAVPSLLSEMPAGTRVGTLLHQVLEETDFAADELSVEVASRLAAGQRWRTVELGDQTSIVDGLCAAIETPLGPLVGETRLRDLPRSDRLAELSFELPLVGGEHPDGELTLPTIAAVLREHLPPDDALADYAGRLSDPTLTRTLRGYLTGTIDLVARIDGGYSLMDYKSNRLASAGEPLTAWHHRPAALAEEMQQSHYALQAMLYAVALHRYLRWRVAGYDPQRDRLSVLYLFLRGMTGANTPRVDGAPCGVFAWRPSPALVTSLSDALDRGQAA